MRILARSGDPDGAGPVVVKVGGNTYESSGQLPAVYLSDSGELSIPIEVQDGQYSKNDKIEITFSVRSMIFSNPGSESGINFYWLSLIHI